MTAPTFLLATDLDGTFLGGTVEPRRTLYADLAARSDVLLVYVTGRDIGFVAALIGKPGMPRPHYIIGDVGTSVYDGAMLQPMAELETEIAARWRSANARVMALLENELRLAFQPTAFRHRVSYDCDPALLSPRAIARVEEAGFDCLLSDSIAADRADAKASAAA